MVFMGNLDYKYHADINDDYVIPDVMVACDRKHLKGGSYSGVPKFIAETLSPATALGDKTVKKEIYQNAGVAEYWIISPSPPHMNPITGPNMYPIAQLARKDTEILSAGVTLIDTKTAKTV